jgi:hypothetical protein
MVPLFPLRGGSVGLYPHVAGVEPPDETLDGTALARSVPTFENYAQWRAQPAVAHQASGQEAQVEEAALQAHQAALTLLPGHFDG